MFERFTPGARAVVVHAQVVSRELGHRVIDVPDLLIALVEVPDQMAGGILRDAGLDGGRLRRAVGGTADAAVLEALGIDLAEVRSRVEGVFGDGALDRARRSRGHRPFSRPAKKVLELALREALARQDRTIEAEHLLLAILREAGDAAVLLEAAGVDRELVEAQIVRRRAAA